MNGMDRRLARIERDGGSGVPDLVAVLDAARSEEAQAMRAGSPQALQARRREQQDACLAQLTASLATRRLTRLEGRMHDALGRLRRFDAERVIGA